MSQAFDPMFELWPAVVGHSCYSNYALVLTELLSLGKHVRIKFYDDKKALLDFIGKNNAIRFLLQKELRWGMK